MQEEEFQYPFIFCSNDTHKRFSPLTAISHILIDEENEEKFHLCCSQCLKKKIEEDNTIKSLYIEDYLDELMSKKTPPDNSNEIFEKVQTYLEKIPITIKEYEEKHEKVTIQFQELKSSILGKLQFILDFVNKHFNNTREHLLDGFRQSYSLIAKSIEKLLIQHKESSLADQQELEAKINKMRKISTVSEYYDLINDLRSSMQTKPFDVSKELIDLKEFMELTNDEARIMDFPFSAINLAHNIVENVTKQLNSLAKKMSFVRQKIFESYLDPIIEKVQCFDDPSSKIVVENLSKANDNMKMIARWLNDDRSFEVIAKELNSVYA